MQHAETRATQNIINLLALRKLSNGDPRSQIPPALAPITPPLVELVTYWTGRVTPEGGALRIKREIGRNQNLEF